MTTTDLEIYGLFLKSDPDRIRYVGQSIMGSRKRFWAHANMARNGTSNRRPQPVTQWIRKHGENAVDFRVLAVADTEDHLQTLEVEWITRMRDSGQADLNVHDGGKGGRKPLSPQEKILKAERLRELRLDPEWEERRLTRLRESKQTPEYRVRMSAIKSGEGNPQFGRIYTEIERQRMSLACSPFTEDDIRSIRNRKDLGESQKAIAESYGVDPSTISKIANKKRFGWVD